jgi:biotin transport system substrate-specific component
VLEYGVATTRPAAAGRGNEGMASMTSSDGRRDRRFTARDLALVAVFCGIVAALGVVPALYPFGQAVPITAQSMGVMLAGALLGARRAGLALLLFVALVAAGLPLLAGGVGGIGMFVTPRAGFLIGFPVAAFAVGWITERIAVPYRLLPGILANVLGGIVVLYIPGILGIALFGNLSLPAAAAAALVFIPGDLVKAVLAAVIARGVHRAYPLQLRNEADARA